MLLLVPGVRECSDVRNFLAPQALSSPVDSSVMDQTLQSPLESSVESLSNMPINGLSSPKKLTTVPEPTVSPEADSKSTISKPSDYVELTPITIPIFDMMTELFDLHHENNWPRKALIDAVQRLLGGRIERSLRSYLTDYRIVRDQVGKYLMESYIVDMVKQVQEAIWPNGTMRKSPQMRSAKEKAKTKRDAGFKLATIFEGHLQGNRINIRVCRKYYGTYECSIWSGAIGVLVSEFSFEYPFCIFRVR